MGRTGWSRVVSVWLGLVGWVVAGETLNFNAGWRFQLGDMLGFEQADFADAEWEAVRLPHDFSIELPRDFTNKALKHGAYFQTGIGCYRKSFVVPQSWTNRAVYLDFDGIYENSEIWINGQSLGKRPYGYAPIWHEIADKLHPGTNVVAVRADNSNMPNSRWYTGSGIYRDVKLTIKDRTHIAYRGVRIVAKPLQDGSYQLDLDVKIKPPSCNAGAVLTTKGTKQHKAGAAQPLTCDLSLVPPMPIAPTLEGRLVAPDGSTVLENIEFSRGKASVQVARPLEWSPETPNLYWLELTLKQDGSVVDRHEERFGFRDFRMDPQQGLFLNGQNIKLKGVCLHHDAGAVGSAFYRSVWERRLGVLKEMGCNAIRTSHNIPARGLIDLCEEMGFIVLAEVFDGLRVKKRDFDYHLYFDEWWKRDLLSVIERDRNSPAIIMWSIGNEIKEKGDAVNGPPLVRAMVEEVHRLDPTRPATCGNNFIFAANASGVSQELDVVGYNDGGGSVWEYANDKAKYPDRLIYGSEVPHTFSTRGMYRTTTKVRKAKPDSELDGTTTHKGEWVPNLSEKELWPEAKKYSSSYDNSYTRISVRGSWKLTRDLPFMMGEFRWTGIDYLGESGEKTNGDYGVIDLCGFKKDPFYLLQSFWTTEPMVHLLPHWNHDFKPGTIVPVWAYSNCDEVELFLNGKSLGRQAMDRDILHNEWRVPYEQGKLEAVAYRDGQRVAQTQRITAGAPARIVLKTDRTAITANGNEIAHIRAEIQDARGNVCPTAMNLVEFAVSGAGKRVGVDNGDPWLKEAFYGDKMPAFNGLCLLMVQATEVPGWIEIEARAEGLAPGRMKIMSAPAP